VLAGLLASVLPFLYWHGADTWFGLPGRERPWLLGGSSPLALGILFAAVATVAATFAWASWIPAVLLGDPSTIDSEVRRSPAPGQLLSQQEAWSAKMPFCGSRAATALVPEAVEHGRRDDLRRYLAAARDPAIRFPIELRGVEYLARAAREGDVDAVRMLLESGVDPRADASALPNAVEAGRSDILRLLADRGATPAGPEEVREDPWKNLLSVALRARQDDALVTLLELGWVDARATLNPGAWGGSGPLLDVVLIRGLPKSARALRERGAPTAAPILAPLLEGDLAGMRAILPEREWSTARPFDAPILSFAARAGQLAVVRRLLDLGADPAASARIEPSDPPTTALDEAVRRGHLEVAKLLAGVRGAQAYLDSNEAVAAAAREGR